MNKPSIPDPFKLSVRLQNHLPQKVYAIVTPSEDYHFAQLIVGFAGMASGIAGLAGSAGALEALIRGISLMKDGITMAGKLKEDLPKFSVMVPPRARVNVFDLYRNKPEMLIDPVNTFNLFGGAGFSLLVVDESMTRVVLFNTGLDQEYEVNEQGVKQGNSVRRWNGGGLNAGLSSSAPPSIALVHDNMLMAYRDANGNAIFMAQFSEGRFSKYGTGALHFDTNQGVGIAERNDLFFIAGRDPKGEQEFALEQVHHWNQQEVRFMWMGYDIEHRPSAASLTSLLTNRDVTVVVAKHLHPGNAVLWTMLTDENQFRKGNTGCDTKFAPAVCGFEGRFVVAYVDFNDERLKIAWSKHPEQKWHKGPDLKVKSSSGPALAVYKGRLYVFYRDPKGNGVFYMYSDDGLTFHEPGNTDLKYIGLDVEGEPSAAALPGDDKGILVVGIRPLGGSIIDKIGRTPHDIGYIIFRPEEHEGPKQPAKKERKAEKKKAAPAKEKPKQKPAPKKKAAKKAPAKGKPAAKKKAVKKSVKKVAKKVVKKVVKKSKPSAVKSKAAPKKKSAGKKPVVKKKAVTKNKPVTKKKSAVKKKPVSKKKGRK